MRKLLSMFLVAISSFVIIEAGFCGEKFAGINPSQPIFPGGVIYYDEQLKIGKPAEQLDYFQYIYLGLDNKNIRIRYKARNDITMHVGESDQIIIPIDDNNQAILSVNQVSPYLPTIKLLITVVNNDNGIMVKKYTGS